MNKEIFRENLLKCVGELLEGKESICLASCKFIIIPINEEGKSLNSTDDYIRLTILSKKNTEGRYFSLDNVVKLFSGLAPLYPIWINVGINKLSEGEVIIELKTSLRFRKPSILQNQDLGYPPFKAVKN